jgi:stearoyl-CoA desaturase (delta-9 desaturase)
MAELIYLLVMTHITIVCVTLFLHRGQTHRGLEFNSGLSHFMRFWLWLTTGMVTKQWVAIHRKHHQNSDKEGDPHSPHNEGIWFVLFAGVSCYVQSAKDKEMIQKYGVGTPDDWIEKHVYSRFPYAGIVLMLAISLMLFGWWGIWFWAVQMVWIPFWAAGVVNGAGHYYGYRNYDSKDKSTNIVPWGIIIGGEELHNNHHGDPANPKLSRKPLEVDMGWMWFKIFNKLGLAKERQ